jgi:flavodoxin
MKTLVVYYTRTGNSKFAAEIVAAELGADKEEVVDLKNRQGKLAYMSCGRDAMSGKITEIAQTKKNPADYDLIVIAQPVWAWSPTPAIRTYLSKNDLTDKKVALFFGGENLKQAVDKTKALIPNSTFVDYLAVEEPLKNKDEATKKITEWSLKLKEM